MLGHIRGHVTFQTTDCATPTTSAIHQYVTSPSISSCSSSGSGADSGTESVYGALEPTLSRQSTVCTTSSIDEGLEADLDGPSGVGNGKQQFSSGELLSSDSTSSSMAGSPFESFDSQIESDVMSSLSSCPQTSEGDVNSGNPGLSFPITTTTTPPTSSLISHSGDPGTYISQSAHPTPFRQGWRASDNTMYDSVSDGFPQLQLRCKAKGVISLNKTAGGNVADLALHKLRITPAGAPYPTYSKAHAHVMGMVTPTPEKRFIRQRPPLPKRISLPENLEFQPQKLLINKQKQLVAEQALLPPGSEVAMVPVVKPPETAGTPPGTSKSALLLHQARLAQKRQILQKQARRQILRQQSYQMAQKHSVIPGEAGSGDGTPDLLTLPGSDPFFEDRRREEGLMVPTPLSPIEDASVNCEKEIEEEEEDTMDTTN